MEKHCSSNAPMVWRCGSLCERIHGYAFDDRCIVIGEVTVTPALIAGGSSIMAKALSAPGNKTSIQENFLYFGITVLLIGTVFMAPLLLLNKQD